LAYQLPASSTFLSEQTSHQQPVSSTLLSEQTSTSHQPPANRTGCMLISKPFEKGDLQLSIVATFPIAYYQTDLLVTIHPATAILLEYCTISSSSV
jgi:hypothetical protein